MRRLPCAWSPRSKNRRASERGIGVEAENGCQQLIDVGPLEGAARFGLKVPLRCVREFFDCHDKPFPRATSISGLRTRLSPEDEAQREVLDDSGAKSLFLLVCK